MYLKKYFSKNLVADFGFFPFDERVQEAQILLNGKFLILCVKKMEYFWMGEKVFFFLISSAIRKSA